VRNGWKFTCVLVAAVQLAGTAVPQQVVTESGTISGVLANGLRVYKGIPFAAPPVGDFHRRLLRIACPEHF
jgi:para-nitrobenzyl esterase